jgi:hypothetical protein
MDSEPKKAEIDEEAKFWQDMDEVDDEEDEISPSAGNDEIDREEAMYDMLMTELKEWDFPELVEKMRAEEKKGKLESEEDTDEDDDDDEEEYENDDEFRKICNTKNWCGRA